MSNKPGQSSGNKRADEWVIKDNLFHRRVTDVRNQVTWDFDSTEKAIDILQTGGPSRFGASAQQQPEYQPLSDEEI